MTNGEQEEGTMLDNTEIWQEEAQLEMDLAQTRKENSERHCLIICNNIWPAGQNIWNW